MLLTVTIGAAVWEIPADSDAAQIVAESLAGLNEEPTEATIADSDGPIDVVLI